LAAVGLRSPFHPGNWPACPLHTLTGLYCPLCGLTRATWALAHLRFGLMVHANALYPALLVLAAWGWLGWLGRASGRWRLPPLPSGRRAMVAAAVVLVAFTVVRNLSFGPGPALAPPGLA
jgi:hypothetical protein